MKECPKRSSKNSLPDFSIFDIENHQNLSQISTFFTAKCVATELKFKQRAEKMGPTNTYQNESEIRFKIAKSKISKSGNYIFFFGEGSKNGLAEG